MTQQEVIEKVKINNLFLYYHPEWNDNKVVVIEAVKANGLSLSYASKNLRNNKEIILESVKNDSMAAIYSLLEGYQTFDDIIEKEGEDFLFSCYKNNYAKTAIQVANHPNFNPNKEQMNYGLQHINSKIRKAYEIKKELLTNHQYKKSTPRP